MHRGIWAAYFGAVAVCAAVVALPAVAGHEKGWNLSFGAAGEAGAADVGLPLYPGSRPHMNKDHDSSAAHVWASAGPFGLKVAVVELETADAPDKVAGFYRPALGKYGALLDCSAGVHSNRGHVSGELNCDSDSPDRGELVFKAGRDQDQHIVAVKPNGQGSIIDLVYVHLEGLGG